MREEADTNELRASAAAAPPQHRVVDLIRQSPPIDLSIPYDVNWLRGKTILITGGASGFGAGFVRKWAPGGCCLIVSDINASAGDALVRDVRKETGNHQIHFVHCDVTSWDSQAAMFREAVRLSPTGGLDAVVANAGIASVDPFLTPSPKLSGPDPPKPDFRIVDVNFIGLLYTAHLAWHYLPLNPGSKAASPSSDPANAPRDRHLLLLGSIASLGGLAGQPQYGAAKHAVLGLFRSLRATSFERGIRINLLCPYFIETPIITPGARILLAGGATGKPEDVVDAATRLTADTRIVGRGLVVGPKMRTTKQSMDGSWVLAGEDESNVQEQAIWECYVDDWEDSELFCRRYLTLLSAVEAARGWGGWAWDVVSAIRYGISKALGGR